MDSRLPTDRWNHRLCWIWATLVMLGMAPVWAQQTETGVPTDQPLQNNSASAIVPFEHLGYGSRLRVDHRAGESIGSDTSYTSLSVLAPFWNIWSDVGDEIVGFVDGRFVVRNDRRVASNIGLGGRWYSARNDWLIGASVWWDIDDTHENSFKQVGVSLESFTENFDLRSNFYFPVGDKRQSFGFGPTSTTPFLVGSNISFARVSIRTPSPLVPRDPPRGRVKTDREEEM